MFIGVDVGGTNTDAVLMDGGDLLAKANLPTTPDVTSGIVEALKNVLTQRPPEGTVDGVMVGTTHFTNALLERKQLPPTAVDCDGARWNSFWAFMGGGLALV